ncbi:helix-turn-helix domain-containing protein [Albimonas sp. CAU 1670]|uniref:AraC family transcriptional regulator n=1 Tax=Albimonas sp. CAU 1670 TaxID=3032599 RepID=UPI0023DC697A|nr:helix-turn-helix domain-containing protein [Albimonas sp. CAU 1670]MDF2233157.1 helix-turn-helix domain-containing protein [Albimonas sp. CAU 1670]
MYALKTSENQKVDEVAASALAPESLRLCRRYQDHLFDQPVLESEVAQIGRGAPRYVSEQIRGRDMRLVRLRFAPKAVTQVVMDPDWILLLLPLALRGRYVFNGLEARSFDLFISAGRDGCATFGEHRDTLSVGLRRARFEAACRALAGGSIDCIALSDQRLPLGADEVGWLRHRFLTAIDAARSMPTVAGSQVLSEVVENDLITDIAAVLAPHTLRGPPREPARCDALRVVRAARRAIDARRARPPSLADLCAAAGVGQTWLHRCFVEVCGTSPVHYLRASRLSMARDRLLDPQSRSVKDAALQLGFLHSGRFAADYSAMFGESPKETLLSRPDGQATP